MKIQPKLGQLIAKYRKERGLSQERLAYLSDLNEDYIGKIEQGKRIPSLVSLMKIISQLKLSPGEFFGDF